MHRRRLALLALLATVRPRSLGRERLIGLLWPESTQDAARHLLSEALYVLRKTLGDDAFVAAGDEVGLAATALWCDVTAFEEALISGDLAEAVSLYAGPFLDGFYVSDAQEFERWAEAERDRLAHDYARALERLAEANELCGDALGAVGCWRRLVAHDPYSSRAVLRLMRALDVTGDRAAAIRLAESHAASLRTELEAEPEPAVIALAARLREDPAAASPMLDRLERLTTPSDVTHGGAATQPPGERPVVSADPGAVSSVGLALGTAVLPSDRASIPHVAAGPADGTDGTERVRRHGFGQIRSFLPARWEAWRAIAAASVVGALVWAAATALRTGAGAARPARAADVVNVVVLPVWGAGTPGIEAVTLHRVLVSSLAAVPRIWTIDGSDLFAGADDWWRRPFDQVLGQARAHHGRYLVTAELVPGSPAALAVRVYDARSGEQIVRETGGGPAEPLRNALQRIALEVARALAARENLDLGEAKYLIAATESPTALSRFLLARDLFRASDFDAAAGAFRLALDADSSFLLAYHRLSVVETWNPRWDFAAARAAVDAGLRRRDRVAPIYGRLLDAQRRFVMRDGVGAIEEFQRLTVDDPSLIDGWLGLAESLFHYRGFVGGGPLDALGALERLVAADSMLGPAYDHLAELAVRMGDEGRARRYAPRVANAKEKASYQFAVKLRFGSASERAAALAALDTADRNTISNLVRIFGDRPGLVDTLGALLMRVDRSPADRRWGADYRLLAQAAQGRWLSALQVWRSLPATDPFDKWIMAADFAGYSSGDLTAPMLAWARQRVAAAGGPDLSRPATPTRDPFRALVHQAVLRGDSADVQRLLAWLEAAAGRADAADPEPEGLRDALRARLALLARDSTGATAHLARALARAPWWVSPWAPLADAAPERLLLAKLYAAQGHSSDANRWLNSFGNISAVGDLLYAPEVERQRAMLRAGKGRQSR